MFFKRKHWTEKLTTNVSINAQAKARYDRHIANGIEKADAERRVRAWATNQLRALSDAHARDPWSHVP